MPCACWLTAHQRAKGANLDIIAHTLWAGVGVAIARRHFKIAPRTCVLTVLLAALPDVLQLLPIIGWSVLSDGSIAVLRAYVIAVPGEEPGMPSLVILWSHHLHCITHSAIVASAVTLLLWVVCRSLWIPLLGWWSHLIIDVFTHSADYYPSPVLYPITQAGFDGIAWNTPWFMALNYGALGLTGCWLWRLHVQARELR